MAPQPLCGRPRRLVTFRPTNLPGACRRASRRSSPTCWCSSTPSCGRSFIGAARAGRQGRAHNGRLRPRNVARYRLLFHSRETSSSAFDLLLMRDEDEAERALSLGAPRDRVHVTGNTKFDALALSVPERRGPRRCARPCRSPTERALGVRLHPRRRGGGPLARVLRCLRRDHPDLRLVIAPRYIERAQRVLALARSTGLGAPPALGAQPGAEPVIVLDTIGELSAPTSSPRWCSWAAASATRGGQNILEPAACGKPVLFGPHMENFHDSVQVLVGRGGIQVNDPVALLQAPARPAGAPGRAARSWASSRPRRCLRCAAPPPATRG